MTILCHRIKEIIKDPNNNIIPNPGVFSCDQMRVNHDRDKKHLKKNQTNLLNIINKTF